MCLFRLDDWALNVIPQLADLFDKVSVIWYTGYIRTNETLKAKGGFLLREIFERIKDKTLGILNPDRSLWIYSAHDNTLINTLSVLNIFDVKLPTYTLRFELKLLLCRL